MLAVAIVAPLAPGVMQTAASRSPEFEADRGAAHLYRSARPLADALERIERLAQVRPMAVAAQEAYAWIHNPLAESTRHGGLDVSRLFSTHPDTAERIRRLRTM